MNQLANFVSNVLTRAGVANRIVRETTSPAAMQIFLRAFTPAAANPEINYETLEQTGDAAVNHVIVRYLAYRFPQLNSPKGIDMIGRLKSKYHSGAVMASVAAKNGFREMVQALQTARVYENNVFAVLDSNLEDIFEAFFGALELVVDVKFGMGVSMPVIFDVVRSFYDQEEIILSDENLTEVKTRLNELFQAHPALGPLNFQSELYGTANRGGVHNYRASVSAIMPDGTKDVVGVGVGKKIKEAEKNAAAVALTTLARRGYERKVPKIFVTTVKQSKPQLIELNNLLNEKINFAL